MLATSRCAADTMPQSTPFFGGNNNGSLAFSIKYTTEKKHTHMGEKRQWDESRSPQWRYLLSKDSKEKRERQKREERLECADGELLKKGVSKRKRKSQERHRENRKLKSKSGKEILYSASPGGENSSYRNEEFIKSRQSINIINNNKTSETKVSGIRRGRRSRPGRARARHAGLPRDGASNQRHRARLGRRRLTSN